MIVHSETSKTPYPTIGEICQFIAGAFDTKASDAQARKKLDRLAREGDFDWSLHDEVIKKIIAEPLKKRIDSKFSDFIERTLRFFLKEYIRLINAVSADALSRDQLSPLLIKKMYVPYILQALEQLRKGVGRPDLITFLGQKGSFINAVVIWAKEDLSIDLVKVFSNSNKQKQDEVGRWRRGDTLPSFFPTLTQIQNDLKNAQTADQDADIFIKWFLVARAVDYARRELFKIYSDDLIDCILKEKICSSPIYDIGKIISQRNIEESKRLNELMESGLRLCFERLDRSSLKKSDEQSSVRKEVERFRELLSRDMPDGRAQYFLDWCEGRWLVLSNREKDALRLYESAVNGALYRAGKEQKTIMEEAIGLAAFLADRAAVKRLKHRAMAMELFCDAFAGAQGFESIVSDWEMDQLKQAFILLFPPNGRFKEAHNTGNGIIFPFRMADMFAIEKIAPDLAHPDRVITIPTYDGEKWRMPQLIWFASANRATEVEKLLDVGADINIADSHGGSALLCALQRTQDRGEREALDVLLGQQHDGKTLDRITHRKGLSPLLVAILIGDPGIVSTLLEMGADANLDVSFPRQSLLYICAEKYASWRSEVAKRKFLQRLLSPSPEDGEIVRRYVGGTGGVFGNDLKRSVLKNSRHLEILSAGYDALVVQKRAPASNLDEIVQSLLEHGANPNKAHDWPAPGRTPLLVAVENDAEVAVRLMLRAGGDPYQEDENGYNAFDLARGFGSQSVVKFLSKLYD